MLDEWVSSHGNAQQFQSHSSPSQGANADYDEEALDGFGPRSIARDPDNQMFTVEVLERNPTRGHGVITCVAAGNNVIVVGTNRGWLIRHDFSGGDCLELDLNSSKASDQRVLRVFVDPAGRHTLLVVETSDGSETHYLHSRSKRTRILSRFKGLTICAVAWNKYQLNEVSQDMVVGTSGGQLLETSLEEKEKREKPLKLLYELTELNEPIVGLQMETSSVGSQVRNFLMAVTPTRLYSFTGLGSLETMFSAYMSKPVRFTELPGEQVRSELHFSAKHRRTEIFAWLAGPGIYYGELNLALQQTVEDYFIENKSLLEYTKLDGGSAKPCALALSEFHFLLLYENKLKVVNRVSQTIVEEKVFDSLLDQSTSAMVGLCTDAIGGAIFAYNENSLYEIVINDEGRDMWLMYLSIKDYATALEHCRDGSQKDRVFVTQADIAFAAKDYITAAVFYAKSTVILTFEEIALKFIAEGELDALRTYLLRKLDNLGKEDRSQITMISTWAVELYLDKINSLLSSKPSELKGNTEHQELKGNTEHQELLTEFRAFLSDCKDVLDEATTLKLLGSYGRVEELIYFAGLKEQHETVIHHYIQQGEAKMALSVLRKPNVSPELQYKFAADLIMLDAYETVEFWMTMDNLNPRRLIPALMRYSSRPHSKDETHEAIKYLEFCVQHQENKDSAVHNLLLSLYAKQDDEGRLLRFLESNYGKGRPGQPEIFYDPKYALRLCLKEKRMRACVYIYSTMNMHEEAVALALQVDPELAKAEADKVEDDPELQKKLWLMVAKHVIQQEKGVERENIRRAIAFLKEADGLLKIEDILPFFPDFALIDDFKEAICASLEDYNKQINRLKQEMNDATRGADNIRRDISTLTQRYAIVDRDEKCGVCALGILRSGTSQTRGVSSVMAPFYVFPCEHSFHAQCLLGHIIKYKDKNETDQIMDLQRRLAVLFNSGSINNASIEDSENPSFGSASTPSIDQVLCEQLDDAIAGECPYCGELMIKEISRPFISMDETDEILSWQIKRV
ncbi:hypothetical protein KP509_34G031500 [Ceratopteris richardii]|uniref:Pep3/Vps18/deep orange domain-containing protein n=1 Tax=Ceratopteris richardii TaxID=49495 RepID=A0A8T2QKZ8_CERRI|nr:hypothetical protein KP509_34G031500 [Ceratopteris richardii]